MARRSKKSLEGEIFISHAGSPGVDPQVAEWAGIHPAAVAKNAVYEGAIYVCNHCQTTIMNNPPETWTEGRHHCPKCDEYICNECMAIMKKTLRCRNVQEVIDNYLDGIAKGIPESLLEKL